MTLPQTLLEAATDLATDAAAKAAYAADPESFLLERGLEDWSAEDLNTALEHVGDALPADLAAQLPEASAAGDPSEAFGALADVDPEVDEAALAFGAGEADESDGDEDGADVEAPPVHTDDGAENAAEEAPTGEAWTDALDPGEDEVEGDEEDVELDFGTGADEASDDVGD